MYFEYWFREREGVALFQWNSHIQMLNIAHKSDRMNETATSLNPSTSHLNTSISYREKYMATIAFWLFLGMLFSPYTLIVSNCKSEYYKIFEFILHFKIEVRNTKIAFFPRDSMNFNSNEWGKWHQTSRLFHQRRANAINNGTIKWTFKYDGDKRCFLFSFSLCCSFLISVQSIKCITEINWIIHRKLLLLTSWNILMNTFLFFL